MGCIYYCMYTKTSAEMYRAVLSWAYECVVLVSTFCTCVFCVCMHACMLPCMHACVCVCKRACMHACMHMFGYVYMCVCVLCVSTGCMNESLMHLITLFQIAKVIFNAWHLSNMDLTGKSILLTSNLMETQKNSALSDEQSQVP